MIHYVVGLIVDKFDYVLLIRKNRPEWQAGRLNGIGGRVEEGETPYEAMVRECSEECGLGLYNWLQLGTVTNNTNYTLYYFIAETSNIIAAKSMTDEEVEIYHLDHLHYPDVIPPTDVFLRLGLSPMYKQMNLEVR